MIIGNKDFNVKNKTYIMGILNITPDSFSDGGKYNKIDKALLHCEEMISQGADIIDIGGESTRPGHKVITSEEEKKRVIPVIKEIKKRFDIPISIDTYKSTVAKAAIEVGADIVNDIWGLKADKDMAELVKKSDVVCIITHNSSSGIYNDFLNDVIKELNESINIAKNIGISQNKIIIDPGIGFGKSYENNIEITKNIDLLVKLGYPVLYAASRKSMIGNTLNLPENKRLEGTIATSVWACINGCSFIRVHDVNENKQAVKMIEKILQRI